MNLGDLIRLMAEFLEKFEVDHFTFGAVAMNFWVPPRFTHDLDIVLCIKKGALPRLVKELNVHGFKITSSLQRKLGEGRLIKLPIDDTELDLVLCAHTHDYEALKRAKKFVQGSFEIFVASAEDIVLYKLKYWRRQDQADVAKIVAEYKPLDQEYIEIWLGKIEEDEGFPVRKRWEAFLSGGTEE